MRRTIIPFMASLSLAFTSMAGEPTKTTLTLNRLDCAGCTSALERQLGMIQGVTAYLVNPEKGEAVVTCYFQAHRDRVLTLRGAKLSS